MITYMIKYTFTWWHMNIMEWYPKLGKENMLWWFGQHGFPINHCLNAHWSDKYHTGMTCWKLSTTGTYLNGTWNYFQYLWNAKVTWVLKLLSMIFTYLSCFEVWFVTWSHRYNGRHFFRSIYSSLIYVVSYLYFAFCPPRVSCSWILLHPWKVYWYQSS